MHSLRILGALTIILPLALFGSATDRAASQEAPPADMEIQTRGPVHEAYAQPIDFQAEPGQVAPKEPPPPIPEEPPDERPEGHNVQWIPGYWAWDPTQNQFVWVSGVWRDVPPGRQWVPGHWVYTDEGWRWVPGFWAPQNQSEFPYTPEPPAPLEVEPALPPPNADSYYIPGYWVYQQYRFIWRPGFYAPCRLGRIWISPRYLWSPNGYIFCDGYWDYPLENRGLLFAPVCFGRPYWTYPGWRYRPSYVLALGLLDSLFCRRGHYYFGNYYGPRYAGLGYQPWFAAGRRHDPVFNYYRWQNRNNPTWYAGLQQTYADRAAGKLAAPPANFAQQRLALKNQTNVQTNVRVVAPLSQVDNQKVRLTKLSSTQLQAQKTNQERARELSLLRNKTEAGGLGKTPRLPGEAKTLKLPPLALGQGGQVSPDGGVKRFSEGGSDSKSGGKGDTPRKGDKGGGLGLDTPKSLIPKGDGPKTLTPQQPKTITNQPGINAPKVGPPLPKVVTPTPQPKVVAPPPQPKVFTSPTPKIGPPAPKINAPMPQPKAITSPTPKISPPAPKINTPMPQPKALTNPTPKISPPAPKINTPMPQPKAITNPTPKISPPAPKINTPMPQPKAITNPTPKISPPAPKINAPAPRFNPPATPKAQPKTFSNPAPKGQFKAAPVAPRVQAPAQPRIQTPAPQPRATTQFKAPSGGGFKGGGAKGRR